MKGILRISALLLTSALTLALASCNETTVSTSPSSGPAVQSQSHPSQPKSSVQSTNVKPPQTTTSQAPASASTPTTAQYLGPDQWPEQEAWNPEPYDNTSDGQLVHIELSAPVTQEPTKLVYRYLYLTKVGDVDALREIIGPNPGLQVSVENLPKWIQNHPTRKMTVQSLRILTEEEIRALPQFSEIKRSEKSPFTEYCLVEVVSNQETLDRSGNANEERGNGTLRDYILLGRTQQDPALKIIEYYWGR